MTLAISTRRLATALLLVAVGGMLAGCDSAASLHSDAIEVQLSPEGGLLIAVCEDIRVGRGFGEVRSEVSGEWVTFWEAEGDVALGAGTVGHAGDSPFGLAATKDDIPVIGAGDRIAVQLVPPDGALDAYVIITIEDPTAATGKWVDSRGEVALTPCSAGAD